jgi:hypothetical protein
MYSFDLVQLAVLNRHNRVRITRELLMQHTVLVTANAFTRILLLLRVT